MVPDAEFLRRAKRDCLVGHRRPRPQRKPRRSDRPALANQDRKLTNAGIRSDVSYVKGIHNVKAGVTYQQTFLDENNRFGIVDPAFLDSLADANGNSCVDSSGNAIRSEERRVGKE